MSLLWIFVWINIIIRITKFFINNEVYHLILFNYNFSFVEKIYNNIKFFKFKKIFTNTIFTYNWNNNFSFLLNQISRNLINKPQLFTFLTCIPILTFILISKIHSKTLHFCYMFHFSLSTNSNTRVFITIKTGELPKWIKQKDLLGRRTRHKKFPACWPNSYVSGAYSFLSSSEKPTVKPTLDDAAGSFCN